MFGYVIVNKPELKIKDFDTYQSFYCGLCKALHEDFGRRGQLTLNFDLTFLAILLMSRRISSSGSDALFIRCTGM